MNKDLGPFRFHLEEDPEASFAVGYFGESVRDAVKVDLSELIDYLQDCRVQQIEARDLNRQKHKDKPWFIDYGDRV